MNRILRIRRSLPTSLPVVFCAAGATAVDALFTTRLGWGLGFPTFDASAYLLQSDAARHTFSSGHTTIAFVGLLRDLAPVFDLLMNFHWLVLGYGLTQALIVHFWPMLLLLSLVAWLVGRHGTKPVALLCVVVVALIPLGIGGARAAPIDLVAHVSWTSWNLDDIRPDFLAATLEAWMVAMLIEFRTSPSRRMFLIAGTFLGLALATKPDTFGMVAVLWALGLAVTLRSSGREAVRRLPWLIVPVALVLSLLVGAGQIQLLRDYFTEIVADNYPSIVVQLALIPGTVATLMGLPEAILVVIVMVIAAKRWREAWQKTPVLYLLFGAIALLVPLTSGHSQLYTELPGTVLLIAGTSALIAELSGSCDARVNTVGRSLVVIWVASIVATGTIGYLLWPQSRVAVLVGNNRAFHQVETTMRSYLTPHDCVAGIRFEASDLGLARSMLDDVGWAPTFAPAEPSASWVASWQHNHAIHSPVIDTDALADDNTYQTSLFIRQSANCRMLVVLAQYAPGRPYFSPLSPVQLNDANSLSTWVHTTPGTFRLVGAAPLAVSQSPSPDAGTHYTVDVFVRP